jgi:hypothetical protein
MTTNEKRGDKVKREAMNWVASDATGSTRSKATALNWLDLAPFLSVAIIALALFFLAFSKMEVRRLGYSVLKFSREERSLRDLERDAVIRLAKATRPERLALVAESRLTLRRAEKGQIIQMTENGVALEQ